MPLLNTPFKEETTKYNKNGWTINSPAKENMLLLSLNKIVNSFLINIFFMLSTFKSVVLSFALPAILMFLK